MQRNGFSLQSSLLHGYVSRRSSILYNYLAHIMILVCSWIIFILPNTVLFNLCILVCLGAMPGVPRKIVKFFSNSIQKKTFIFIRRLAKIGTENLKFCNFYVLVVCCNFLLYEEELMSLFF